MLKMITQYSVGQHLECQEVVDLEVVAHGKCWPTVVNGCGPIMFDDGHPPGADGVRLKDDLFREVAKVMTKNRSNGSKSKPGARITLQKCVGNTSLWEYRTGALLILEALPPTMSLPFDECKTNRHG